MIRNKLRFMKAAVGEQDGVDPGGLPPELVGKTPAEIAAYYADQNATILANARRMVEEARANPTSVPNNTPPNPPPSRGEPNYMTREDFDRIAGPAQQGLIIVAQNAASAGKPHWDRALADVKKIVMSLPPDQQVNPDVWSEAYYNVVGRMTETLTTEARNKALGLEQPSPPPPTPAKPRVYTDVELQLCDGLNIKPESYDLAAKRLDENWQPFTIDNRRRA